jgi:urea transporter
MAVGVLAGSAIGTATAWAFKFDKAEIAAGLYGFNSALVGIATLFFFRPSVISIGLLILGCVVAAPLTWLMRRHVPFPTYTTPFILTTWGLYFLGLALGAGQVEPSSEPFTAGFLAAVGHGIGQVMFQACIWTALLFLIGIAISNWQHALWVIAGSLLGMVVGIYHHDSAEEVAALGLYGYNATLAAIALFLWRRSLVWPFLGILLSVPLTEYAPNLPLPALTAPFVLATWLVLALGWFERKLSESPAPSIP